MKNKLLKILILCAVLLLGTSACKKEQLEVPTQNTPVFTASGTIDNNSFSIVAGDDGAYMHTLTNIENGVNVYSGNLMNGTVGIELGVYDGMLDIPNYNILQQLQNDLTFSSSVIPTEMVLRKGAFTNSANIQSIEWYINDQYVGLNYDTIKEPGIYNVRADILFMDQSVKSLSNSMIVGYRNNATSTMSYTLNGSLLDASIINSTSSISKVIWSLDGVSHGETAPQQLSLTNELHILTAQIYYANNVVQTKSMIIDPVSENRTVEDFSIFTDNANGLAPRDFNARLKVLYNGEEYQSESTDNTNSVIKITSIELYGQNSNGNDVYKVTAVIDGMIRGNISGNVVPIHLDMVFGIEVP